MGKVFHSKMFMGRREKTLTPCAQDKHELPTYHIILHWDPCQRKLKQAQFSYLEGYLRMRCMVLILISND